MLEWILKLSGGALIVFSGVNLSMVKTRNIERRVEFIDGLISGFITLEGHICGRLLTVNEALEYAIRDSGISSDVFKRAMFADGDLKCRFSSLETYVCKEDADAVLQYVNGVCSVDETERRTAFNLIRERLSFQRKKAEDDCVRFCKLYKTAGVLGGIAVFILLL